MGIPVEGGFLLEIEEGEGMVEQNPRRRIAATENEKEETEIPSLLLSAY